MLDIKILTATQTMERTLGFTFYRLFLCFAVSFSFVLATLMGSGIAMMMGSAVDKMAVWGASGASIGFVVCGVIVYLARGIWLYKVKARHIALLVDAVAEKVLPQGWAQIEYGRQQVGKRFNLSRDLVGLDRQIRQVQIYLLRTCTKLGVQIPDIPNGFVAKSIYGVIAVPLTYTDEVILAQCFRGDSNTPWVEARNGVVYYAQNFGLIWRNALLLFVLTYAGLFCVYLLMLVPVEWVEGILPIPIGNWKYVFALVFAWPIKAAIFDPIVIAGLILLFFEKIDGTIPNSDWVNRLNNSSDEFKEIQRRAEAEQAPIRAGDAKKAPMESSDKESTNHT